MIRFEQAAQFGGSADSAHDSISVRLTAASCLPVRLKSDGLISERILADAEQLGTRIQAGLAVPLLSGSDTRSGRIDSYSAAVALRNETATRPRLGSAVKWMDWKTE
jgi:hypothetical protein